MEHVENAAEAAAAASVPGLLESEKVCRCDGKVTYWVLLIKYEMRGVGKFWSLPQ
jgi:hypothetical protein